jgi:hypothetical protein
VNAIVTDSRSSDVSRSNISPQTPEVFARFTLADVPPGSQLRAVWIAEQAAGIPSGYVLGETTSSDVGGTQNQGAFLHARPPNGWPTGSYRVDLYLNGELERSIGFFADPTTASPTTTPGAIPEATVFPTPGATVGGTQRTVPGGFQIPTPTPPRTI